MISRSASALTKPLPSSAYNLTNHSEIPNSSINYPKPRKLSHKSDFNYGEFAILRT